MQSVKSYEAHTETNPKISLADSPELYRALEIQLVNWGKWARGGRFKPVCSSMQHAIEGGLAKSPFYIEPDALEVEEVLTTWQVICPNPGRLYVKVLKIEYAEPANRTADEKAGHVQRWLKEPVSDERYQRLLTEATEGFWHLCCTL